MNFLGRLRERRLTVLRFAFAAVAACAVALAGCANVPGREGRGQTPQNIIIMFADGAAPTQWDFGRYSSKVLRKQPFVTTDVVFRQGAVGLLVTSPAEAYVTDSAAAGSAMATGFKANNGAVAVTPDGKPVQTVMEAAKAKGKRTGLVTTATIYDATPAAFSIHAKSRRDSQALVDQFLPLEPDVLMGGGADYFLPAGVPGGKRKDGRDCPYSLAMTRGALSLRGGSSGARGDEAIPCRLCVIARSAATKQSRPSLRGCHACPTALVVPRDCFASLAMTRKADGCAHPRSQ